jgi:zinc transport system ATP-binding protein
MPAWHRLLVLDEPAAGLDPIATSELYALLTQLNAETETTVIMVTHDIQAAEKYATRILYLENSRCFFGSAAEYKARPETVLRYGG